VFGPVWYAKVTRHSEEQRSFFATIPAVTILVPGEF